MPALPMAETLRGEPKERTDLFLDGVRIAARVDDEDRSLAPEPVQQGGDALPMVIDPGGERLRGVDLPRLEAAAAGVADALAPGPAPDEVVVQAAVAAHPSGQRTVATARPRRAVKRARQAVSHGHIRVEGHKVDKPAYRCVQVR